MKVFRCLGCEESFIYSQNIKPWAFFLHQANITLSPQVWSKSYSSRSRSQILVLLYLVHCQNRRMDHNLSLSASKDIKFFSVDEYP